MSQTIETGSRGAAPRRAGSMTLFTAPGFSSLADHIAMLEAGLQFDVAKVDFSTKQIEGGGHLTEISAKGYVPALVLSGGEVLTENVAILAWVADNAPDLTPKGPLGRYRLLEMLAFIASEIHKRFPAYMTAPEDGKEPIAQEIRRWLGFVADRLEHDYLFGDAFTVADAYLFVMARGAAEVGFALPEPLPAYVARIERRPAVQRALQREGIGAAH
jgi:glutathione S-transferase